MEKKDYPSHITVKKIPIGKSARFPNYTNFKGKSEVEKTLRKILADMPRTFKIKIK